MGDVYPDPCAVQDDRMALLQGQKLFLASSIGGSQNQYEILGEAGRGGSSICYNAKRILQDGTPEYGKLKEFYPLENTGHGPYYNLRRSESGQLIPMRGTYPDWQDFCENYLKIIKELKALIAFDPNYEVLKNYIQSSEVLYGCSGIPEQPATCYIWSEGKYGSGLDTVLDDLRSRAPQNSEEDLLFILDVLASLTESVIALHTAGYLHLDIKPENFFLEKNSIGDVTSRISLFDCNSFYSAEEGSVWRCVGTPGYSSPEARQENGAVSGPSDLYSIGGILYHAVMVFPDDPDGIYRDEAYAELAELAEKSRFLQPYSAKVQKRLLAILKKCLHPNAARRYQAAEELLADLQALSAYIRKDQTVKDCISTVRVRTDSEMILQSFLYRHPPLPRQGRMPVFVLGSSEYTNQFIDQILQAGQMPDVQLEISACSDFPEESKQNYLQGHPALSQFIDLDGSYSGEQVPYAALNFLERTAGNPAAPEWASAFYEQHLLKGCAMLLIDFGSERMNASLAKALERLLKNSGQSCPVAYVTGHKRREEGLCFPLWVNAPLTMQNIEPDLEQMAFNAHLCWKPSMNLNIQKEFEEFRSEKENYHSSVAFALGIQTKLRSLGIAETDPLKAAEIFRQKLEKDRENGSRDFKVLTWLEHRRWVLEKACRNWIPRTDLADCLKTSSIQIKRNPKESHEPSQHPCMRFGTISTPLPAWTKAQWDTPGAYDAELDDLDRMSVTLHRLFWEDAKKILQNDPVEKNAVFLELEKLCLAQKNADLQLAFCRYSLCLKNLSLGVKNTANQLGSYRAALQAFFDEETDNSMDLSVKKTANHALAALQNTYFSLLESQKYIDYKKYDGNLVENIPFILTYRQPDCVALPLPLQNDSSALFAGVSSLTLLCPSRVLYVCEVTEFADAPFIQEQLEKLQCYFKARSMTAKIELMILQKDPASGPAAEALSAALEEIGISTTLQTGSTPPLAAEAIACEAPTLWDGSQALYASMWENSRFLAELQKQNIAYFEFDSVHKTFPVFAGCEFLRYFRKDDKTFLRVSDLFALRGSTRTSYAPPDFDSQGIQTLWRIFCGADTGTNHWYAMKNWNNLCARLAEYEKSRFRVRLPYSEKRKTETVLYVLPAHLNLPAQKFLQQLQKAKIAGMDSTMEEIRGGVCRMVLKVSPDHAQPLRSFAGKLCTCLQEPYHLRVSEVPGLMILWDDLTVQNLSLGEEWPENQYKILEALYRNGYLMALSPLADGKTSFVYPSLQMRDLLICAGRILELHSYYQALATDYFDDIACSCSFAWFRDGVNNELDLVLTKSLCSMIVECKSVQQLEVNFIHKLDSLADHFGVNCTKVMVGNTYFSRDDLNASNDLQRSRGEQIGIQNLYTYPEITAVGEKLKQLMEKKFL